MDFMEGLLTRRSVRKYDTSKKISKENEDKADSLCMGPL